MLPKADFLSILVIIMGLLPITKIVKEGSRGTVTTKNNRELLRLIEDRRLRHWLVILLRLWERLWVHLNDSGSKIGQLGKVQVIEQIDHLIDSTNKEVNQSKRKITSS